MIHYGQTCFEIWWLVLSLLLLISMMGFFCFHLFFQSSRYDEYHECGEQEERKANCTDMVTEHCLLKESESIVPAIAQ